jgi:hypothetical protein
MIILHVDVSLSSNRIHFRHLCRSFRGGKLYWLGRTLYLSKLLFLVFAKRSNQVESFDSASHQIQTWNMQAALQLHSLHQRFYRIRSLQILLVPALQMANELWYSSPLCYHCQKNYRVNYRKSQKCLTCHLEGQQHQMQLSNKSH